MCKKLFSNSTSERMWNQLKWAIRLTVICCLPIMVFGQKKKDRDTSNLIFQPHRIEFEATRNNDFTIINGEEDGLGVIIESFKKVEKQYEWTFVKLDSNLEEEWQQSFNVNLSSRLLGYEYSRGKYYVLASASQYRTEELLVFEIEDQKIRKFEITTVFPISLEYFEVIGETILLGGSVNLKPVIITYNLKEKKPKVLPGFYENRNIIMDIIIDDDELMFTVVMRERLITKQYTTRAKTFTSDGLLVQDILVAPGDRRNLIDASSTNFDNGIQLMAGAHSKKSTSYSKGLYLAKFVNGRQQFIRYHQYGDLQNFFGYLNSKREQRIKKRIEKRKSLGKKNKFNYRLVVHDIMEREDGINILVGEAYYPRYSNSTTYANPYFNTGNGAGFLGYKYTHAIVVAFDANGEILWDHSFKIRDVLTYSLDKFIAINMVEDDILLMYLEENEIRTKVVARSEVVEGQTFTPVKLNDQQEEVRSRDPEIEGLEPWVEGSFYAYGIHSVSKSQSPVFGGSRKVFYINKIEYNQNRIVN